MTALLLVLLLATPAWQPEGSPALLTSTRPAASVRDAHPVECTVVRWLGRSSVQPVAVDLECPAHPPARKFLLRVDGRLTCTVRGWGYGSAHSNTLLTMTAERCRTATHAPADRALDHLEK